MWQNFLNFIHLPSPLPEPATLPRPSNANPEVSPQITTNTIQFLLTAYMTWLQPFEQHMGRIKQVAMQRHAAASAGLPPTTNCTQTAPAPSPVQTTAPSPAPTTAPTPSALTALSPRQQMETNPTIPDYMQEGSVRPPPPKQKKSRNVSSKPVPTPIRVEVGTPPQPIIQAVPDTPSIGSGAKRKRDKRGELIGLFLIL